MKIIRWWGILAFLLILTGLVLLWYLLAPGLIKNNIEKYGSQALGARLEISKVELSLFPLAVSLNQLTGADPDHPMQNLFESNKVKFSVDAQSLLWKKLVIDELTLDGVQTGTQRATSGAISKEQKERWKEESLFNFTIPEISQDDIKKVIDSADLISLKRVEQLKQSQKTMEAQWKSALDKNAFEKRIDDIQAEYDRLANRLKKSKMNFIKDRKAWKKLKKSIDAERKTIAQLNQKLKSDKKSIADQLVAVKNGPRDDLAAVKDRFGLGNGVDGLIDKYLGAQYRTWVHKAISMVTQMKPEDKDADDTETSQSIQVGDRVYYKDKHIFPELLIKKININGSDKERKLAGLGFDLGYLPWLTGKPARLDLSLEGKGSTAFSAVSDWPSETEMLTTINSTTKNWQLENGELINTPEGSWIIKSGQLNASFSLSLTLQTIKLNATMSINSPKLSFPESLSGWKKTLATSISQQKSIDLKLTADGTLDKPGLKVSSSISRLFTQAIGEKVKQKAAKYSDKIKAEISNRVGDISGLESFSDQFDQWGGELKNKDQLLESLLGKIKY